MSEAPRSARDRRGPDGDALEVMIELATSSDFSIAARFDVPPGVTVLFGPSGAGKSTILAIIAGLRQPDRGSIKLGGEVWFDKDRNIDRPVHARGISFVFQSLA